MFVRAVAVAVAVGSLGTTALAQTVRHVVPGVHQAAPSTVRSSAIAPNRKFHPIKIGPHTFYGAIVSMSGTSVVIRTRHQRLVTVDATTVLADGTYSAPLFVGKLVTVDGDEAANGVFTAAHISRMTNLNALPNDH